MYALDNKEFQEIIALVEEINNIASRLKRDREFEVILIPAECKKALNGDKRQQNKLVFVPGRLCLAVFSVCL